MIETIGCVAGVRGCLWDIVVTRGVLGTTVLVDREDREDREDRVNLVERPSTDRVAMR